MEIRATVYYPEQGTYSRSRGDGPVDILSASAVHPWFPAPLPLFPPVKFFCISANSCLFAVPAWIQVCFVLVCAAIRQNLPTPEQLKHRVTADCSRLPRTHNRLQI